MFGHNYHCPGCSNLLQFDDLNFVEAKCPDCNIQLVIEDGLLRTKEDFETSKKSDEEIAADAKRSGVYSNLSSDQTDLLAADVVLTTSFSVAGKDILEEIEIVSAECVYGMHIFKDFFSGVRDVFGGRSKAIQDTLRDARRTAMAELRREAVMVGADAVIGVDLDYHEITGGGKGGMIMLVASGTAVKLSE